MYGASRMVRFGCLALATSSCMKMQQTDEQRTEGQSCTARVDHVQVRSSDEYYSVQFHIHTDGCPRSAGKFDFDARAQRKDSGETESYPLSMSWDFTESNSNNFVVDHDLRHRFEKTRYNNVSTVNEPIDCWCEQD
jgi:hypothetical protein